jgi:hypothetical protein
VLSSLESGLKAVFRLSTLRYPLRNSCKENVMSLRTSDVAPISETPDRLTELAEHAGLVLVQGAIDGLEDVAVGRVLDEGELDKALADVPARPRNKA